MNQSKRKPLPHRRRWGAMAKLPEPGKVKTRLAASVGNDAAADIFAAMLEALIRGMTPLMSRGVILTPEGSVQAMNGWLGERDLAISAATQGQGSLGDRMQFVFRQHLEHAGDKFVLIGSDLPSIGPAQIEAAFETLDCHDVVLGPADDGGYWLIGLSGPWQDRWRGLFDNIQWSTETVLGDTIQRCEDLNLKLAMLEQRADIDDIETLQRWLCNTDDRKLAGRIERCIGSVLEQTSSPIEDVKPPRPKTASKSNRHLIVGGGAIGLSLAWQMAKRGESVELIEIGEVGSGATGAAAGILPPAKMETATDALERLRGYSHEIFEGWADELLSSTKIDIGYRRCGGWYLAETPGEAAAMIGLASDWSDAGIDVTQTSVEEFLSREPIWNQNNPTQIISAWWAADERQISPRRYAAALRQAAINEGVVIRENTAVISIENSHGEVLVGCEDGEQIVGDRVVICGGAMAGRLAKSFGLEQSIIPIRGQMLSLAWPENATTPVPKIFNLGNRYVVVRDSGDVLIGSCEEEVGFDRSVVKSTIESLHQFATARVTALDGAEVNESWSGLRPMTFDGLPMIGRIAGQENVFFAGGHYRSGLHLSPGTAITLADHIIGRPTVIDLSSFAVKPDSKFTSH